MARLRCNVCGGELEVNEDLSVGVCKYCDSMITIPKELDKKGNLYNRAIFLRQNNEFDKALEVYEEILREDNMDAEAHWGLVLSKYGIEYVLDPNNQERIPTCHRTQTQSILSDPDYLAALEYFDMEARKVIENQANVINKIQAKILELSQKEELYDIFICYKETDVFGNRTEDSIVAQDLYYELKKKGYRVFFARKTLENKLGAEYEPIIFAALNSAKVMIVLGTKAEHFNAVWVKNEWSRFIRMSKDSEKTIIPAYRGISPYELPTELSVFQSQDMSKIGFMQDLTDGIERCMRKKNQIREQIVQANVTSSLERLLQNGDTYLKLGNINAAEEVYITVTKEYPEDYRGWWGLIVCKTKNFTEVLNEQNTLNVWFRYVKQLAEPKKKFEALEEKYIEYSKKVSLLVADSDMKEVNSIIRKHNSDVKLKKENICNLHDAIKKRENEFKRLNAKDDSKIKKEEEKISGYVKERIIRIIWLIFGWTAIIIGIYLYNFGNKFDYELSFGMMCCIIGIGVFALFIYFNVFTLDLDYLKQDENFSNNEIYDVAMRKDDRKIRFDKDIEMLKQKIEKNEKEIATLNGKIANCNRYLELGKEKIAELWFSKECEQIGVPINYDNVIQEYRKAVFESSENK